MVAVFGSLGDLPVGVIGHIYFCKPVLLFGGNPEGGIGHSERLENLLLQELTEAHTRNLLNYRTQNVRRSAVHKLVSGIEAKVTPADSLGEFRRSYWIVGVHSAIDVRKYLRRLRPCAIPAGVRYARGHVHKVLDGYLLLCLDPLAVNKHMRGLEAGHKPCQAVGKVKLSPIHKNHYRRGGYRLTHRVKPDYGIAGKRHLIFKVAVAVFLIDKLLTVFKYKQVCTGGKSAVVYFFFENLL